MKKFLLVIVYVSALIIGFINKDFFMSWIQSSDITFLPLMFFFSLFLSTIPVIPFTLFAGVMGVKYGLLLGFLINWFGAVTSALIYYVLSRFLFTGYFQKYMNRYKRLRHLNQLIENNEFITILVARVIPIIPPIAINIYSAISRVSFISFLTATLIGTIPPMFFIAYGGDRLFSNFNEFLIGASIYIFFLIVLFVSYKIWLRKKIRYSN